MAGIRSNRLLGWMIFFRQYGFSIPFCHTLVTLYVPWWRHLSLFPAPFSPTRTQIREFCSFPLLSTQGLVDKCLVFQSIPTPQSPTCWHRLDTVRHAWFLTTMHLHCDRTCTYVYFFVENTQISMSSPHRNWQSQRLRTKYFDISEFATKPRNRVRLGRKKKPNSKELPMNTSQ